MTEQSYNVFISYNSKDKPQVTDIVSELFPYVSVWFDRADMLVGEDWLRQVTEGLRCSDTCAIFFGKNGFGPAQLKEIEIAEKLNIRVFCVLLPGGSPEMIYRHLQIPETITYVDLSGGMDRAAFESLVAAILGKPIGWDFLIGLKLAKRAAEWIDENRSSRLLYSDTELEEAQEWLKSYPHDIENSVRIFIEESQKAQRSRERSRRKRTIAILVLAGILTVLFCFMIFYFSPRVLYPPPEMSRIPIQEGAFQPTPIPWLQEPTPPLFYLNGYEISADRVTLADYNQCVRAKACRGPIRHDSQGKSKSSEPISDVTWDESDRFCRWAGGRLPTDIEIRRYYSSQQDLHDKDELDKITFDWTADWCSDCSPPNAFKVVRSFSEPRAMSPEDRYSFVYFRCAWDPL